jgi:Cu/Ag efflux pump CusA
MLMVLLLFMFGVGVVSFLKLNIEAYPDPVPPLVDINTLTPGQSAEEIERYITIPIEIQMAGIPPSLRYGRSLYSGCRTSKYSLLTPLLMTRHNNG